GARSCRRFQASWISSRQPGGSNRSKSNTSSGGTCGGTGTGSWICFCNAPLLPERLARLADGSSHFTKTGCEAITMASQLREQQMDLQLTGKQALVTGSSQGIGRGIAKVLASEGAEVIVHGRNQERAEETAAM